MYKTSQWACEYLLPAFNISLSVCQTMTWVTSTADSHQERRNKSGKVLTTGLTFDSNLCCGFNYAQRRHGDAGVVGWFADVGDFQHIASHWHLVLLGQLLQAHHPLDVGHWWAHCHTGQVDATTWHHLLICGWYRESRWDSSYYGDQVKRKEKRVNW